MRCFFHALSIITVTVSGGIFEYKVPSVYSPDFGDAYGLDLTLWGVSNLLKRTESHPHGPVDRQLMTDIRTENWPLSERDLDRLKNRRRLAIHLDKDSDFEKFNKNADWTYLRGDHRSVHRAYMHRRMVLEESVLESVMPNTDLYRLHWLDEYKVVVSCPINKTKHRYDGIHPMGRMKNKYPRYVKFTYVCVDSPTPCESSELIKRGDAGHGMFADGLDNTPVRVVKDGRITAKETTVHHWRTLYSCETDGFEKQLYPELPERLDSVGLTGMDREFADQPPISAVQLFGVEILRDFRKTIPGMTPNRLRTLEFVDRTTIKASHSITQKEPGYTDYVHLLELGVPYPEPAMTFVKPEVYWESPNPGHYYKHEDD